MVIDQTCCIISGHSRGNPLSSFKDAEDGQLLTDFNPNETIYNTDIGGGGRTAVCALDRFYPQRDDL